MHPFFGRCIGNESEYRIFLGIMISWIIILWKEERKRSEEEKNRGEIWGKGFGIRTFENISLTVKNLFPIGNVIFFQRELLSVRCSSRREKEEGKRKRISRK